MEANKFDGGEDLISDLPDSVLLHVLSFLNVQDTIKTSLLSRRWRCLWMSTFSLDFNIILGDEGEGDIASFIDTSLILHEAANIEKFCISIFYDDTIACHQVDAWIRFALRRNVKELYLDFCNRDLWDWEEHRLYELPRSLLFCESLVTLTLKCCYLKWPTLMQFSSLKTLNLQQFTLPEGMIDGIISCCPRLENLGIKDCNRTSHLIIKTDRELKSLIIEDVTYVDGSGAVLEIYAPKLLQLELKGNCPRAEYRLSDLQSLIRASIDFEQILGQDDYELGARYCDTDTLKKLIDDLCHVKQVKLCSWCIQVLSIRELRCQDTPSLNITYLELNAGLAKWELPGIAHLLKSACNLDTLVLKIEEKLPFNHLNWLDYEEGHDFDEREYWKWLELSFARLLHNLKIVKIRGFLGGGDFSLLDDGSEGMADFLKSCAREIKFVRILVKNLKVLEQLTVSVTNQPILTASLKVPENSKVLLKEAKRVLAFPRASKTAQVSITTS